jgi:predicted RecB family nuclease
MGLSKSKLLAFLQCPRRLWLEQYRPELALHDDDVDVRLAAGRHVGDVAREIYGQGQGHLVTFENGVGGAIETTRELLAQPDTAPIFEATFEYDGLVVRTDILSRSHDAAHLIEVKAAASVKDHYLPDCAIQTWTLRRLGVPVSGVAVAHVNTQFVYRGDGRYEGLLAEVDVTASIEEHVAAVPALVERARATLASAAEPDVAVGVHCGTPFECPFYGHCAPPQGEYPVAALGGSTKRRFELLHAGYRDLRDVPEELLRTPRQRQIWRQTKLGTPSLDAAAYEFARQLGSPRYYLDFETISFAVPIWAGTRPYEGLPFQWSCHVEDGSRALAHAEFLDVSGAAPMRACAEALIAALGTHGAILVYTGFEHSVLARLGERYPDLEPALAGLRERLVDLYPIAKAHYYHPAMRGSWSIKSIVPTIAPDLRYDALGDVQDGTAAQQAYLEAIDRATPAERRESLRRSLLDYCRHDTLAMVKLVELFARSAT